VGLFGKLKGAVKGVGKAATAGPRTAIRGIGSLLGGGNSGPRPRPFTPPPSGGGFSGLATQAPPDPSLPPPPTGMVAGALGGAGMGGPGMGQIAAMLRARMQGGVPNQASDPSALLGAQYPGMGGG
jgi:hypothetical protein